MAEKTTTELLAAHGFGYDPTPDQEDLENEYELDHPPTGTFEIDFKNTMDTIHTKGIYICNNLDTFLPLGEEIQWYGRIEKSWNGDRLGFIITIGDYIICEWSPETDCHFSNRYEKGHHYAGIDKEWVMARMGQNLIQKLLPKM